MAPGPVVIMPLTGMKRILPHAVSGGYGVAAFNPVDHNSARARVDAAASACHRVPGAVGDRFAVQRVDAARAQKADGNHAKPEFAPQDEVPRSRIELASGKR